MTGRGHWRHREAAASYYYDDQLDSEGTSRRNGRAFVTVQAELNDAKPATVTVTVTGRDGHARSVARRPGGPARRHRRRDAELSSGMARIFGSLVASP